MLPEGMDTENDSFMIIEDKNSSKQLVLYGICMR